MHTHKKKFSNFDAAGLLKKIGIKKDDVFLDLGCGNGYIATEASKTCKSFAVDNDKETLSGLDKTEHFIPIITDIRSTGLPEKSVTVSFMSNVLHGVISNNQEKEVFSEINRISTDNCKIAILDFKKIGTYGPPEEIKLSSNEVLSILNRNGFFPERTYDLGDHYLIIAKHK